MNVAILRFMISMLAILTMALWERVRPFRNPVISYKRHVSSNLFLLIFNSLIIGSLFLVGPIMAAEWARVEKIGLLNQFQTPGWVNILVTVVVFDGLIYFQHRFFHSKPFLWQLHGLHHSDPELDFSSAGRFHTIEIFISFLIKSIFVLALGSSVVAIIVFEVILNGMATFNHSNIKLPPKLESVIRLFIVTPEMHRVHHSIEKKETNSNFGFNFSLWDHLFKTYIDQPKLGDKDVVIGLKSVHKQKSPTTSFFWMLSSPFKFKFDDPD